MPTTRTIADLETPCLLLDRETLTRNLARMSEKATQAGVDLRPHCKTAKSAEVARRATANHSGAITVATLNEAEYFARHGFTDITYSLGVEPGKLSRIAKLQAGGARITVVTDSPCMATYLADHAADLPKPLPILIEVDAGYHRTGVDVDSDDLLAMAKTLDAARNVDLTGILTFGGTTYAAHSVAEIVAEAETERQCATQAAARLRDAGFPCPVVSVGSTPTATHGRNFDGVTEFRPGVYVFMDLMQVALGVCDYDDIAVTVLASVIGRKESEQRVYIDAGALALSKDLGMGAGHEPYAPYGLLTHCETMEPYEDIGVANVNQEHGFVSRMGSDKAFPFEAFPVGRRVRVLPNHVCHTVAPYARYHVVDKDGVVVEEWDRCTGW